MRADLDTLEEAVGHRFTTRDLLTRALTHSSLVHERGLANPGEPLHDNEQLEFLGDAILGFVISDHLFRTYPDSQEGRLSKIKAHLVSAVHLYEVARELDLGRYLELGRGEEMSGGRAKKTLLVDAVEAIIAAIYLDAGMDAARAFIHARIILPASGDLAVVEEAAVVDFKSALQELAQARKLPPPRYAIVREQGPEHSKTFTIEVRVGREWSGQAEGYTKKSAAQKAARQVYERIRSEAGEGE